MPSSKQRLWRGVRAKTSGGLRKSDLTKNKRGKIVSKKKSQQAANQNNLGDHLRQKGKKMPKDEMLHKKKKAGGAPAKVEAKPKPAPKAPPKPAPKAAPKPKKQPAQKAPPKKNPAKSKVIKKAKGKINPITGQLRDPEAKTKVSIDNIRRPGRRRNMRKGAWAGF